MKKIFSTLFFALTTLCMFSQTTELWNVVFEDDFTDTTFRRYKWAYVNRGGSDWNRHIKASKDVVQVKNGYLYLKGIKNNDPNDNVPYWTGGLTSRDKFFFQYGKVEVRAKFSKNGKGTWKAIWLMPQDNSAGWPACGEIDIMEHLNFDAHIHHTIHTHYTYTLGIKNNPPQTATAHIDVNDFNTYGLEWYPDRLVFLVNGVVTHTYPKIETDKEGQWPYDKAFYLILNHSLGGSWVGNVDETSLPTETIIDWVKVYKRNPEAPYQTPAWQSDVAPNDPKWKDTYVKSITSTGGQQNLNYKTATRPTSYYVEMEDTLVVNSNATFSLNLDANSLGEYSTSVVKQDLRYTTAFLFEDFDADKMFSFISPKIGNSPPTHNVGGNIETLNIAHSFVAPNVKTDRVARIRVVYDNAWQPARTSADMAVKEGMVYDINIKILGNSTAVKNYKKYPIHISKTNGMIMINNMESENIIKLYDVTGRVLHQEKTTNSYISIKQPTAFTILEIVNTKGERFITKI